MLMREIHAAMSGRAGNLLSFEDVREQLHLGGPGEATRLEEVRLNQIVRSVGRYRDFYRPFLPRSGIDPAR